MKALVIVLVFVLLLLVAIYCLYRFVFCHPINKRPDAHQIPESILYKEYINLMSECINDMEQTPYEEVSILSMDGYRLYGKLYNMKKDAPLVIFFHGYHGLPEWDGYGFFKICKKNGINILMTDERTHGKSEGNAVTFGVKERYDCKLWAEYAIKRLGKNTDLILAGVSMGAASVMMSAELELPENVRALVSDCGFSEPSAIIKETVRKMNLPVNPVYFFIHLGARIFGHFNLEDSTALNAVKQLKIPILFLHGTRDSIVPVDMSQVLYENCTAKKERVLIEGADHANSALTDFGTYEKAVMNFLNSSLSEDAMEKL